MAQNPSQGPRPSPIPADWPVYQIVRLRRHGSRRVLRKALTLAEAQRHCRLDSTHGPNWFDGYELMPEVSRRLGRDE